MKEGQQSDSDKDGAISSEKEEESLEKNEEITSYEDNLKKSKPWIN